MAADHLRVLDDADVRRDLPSVVGRVGSIVETPAAYPRFSGRTNLALLAKVAGVGRSRVREVLEQVGLAERADDLVRTYSFGMKQRLGIGAALLKDPELLILDEPANGLDPAGVVEIRGLLASLAREKGVTVFMSSHILTEVDLLATRIGIIHKGRLIEELDAKKLEDTRSLRLAVRARNLEAAQTALTQAGYAVEVRAGEGTIFLSEARAIDAPDEVAAVLVNAGTPPTRLAVEQEDLEDHFLRLTGDRP